MTLTEVQTELATRLLTWQGGGWADRSYTNAAGDVILRLDNGGAASPESNMSEHSMTVEQVLDVFAAGINSVKVIKQYTRGG